MCTSPLAVNTTVGVLDLFTVHIVLSFILFLLIMCIDVPESTSNSRSSGLFEVGAGNYLCYNRSIERSFVRILELVNVFSPNSTLLCGRIFLGSRNPHFGAQGQRSLRCILLDKTSRWTLAFPNFGLVPGAFGEFDCVFRSQSSRFT